MVYSVSPCTPQKLGSISSVAASSQSEVASVLELVSGAKTILVEKKHSPAELIKLLFKKDSVFPRDPRMEALKSRLAEKPEGLFVASPQSEPRSLNTKETLFLAYLIILNEDGTDCFSEDRMTIEPEKFAAKVRTLLYEEELSSINDQMQVSIRQKGAAGLARMDELLGKLEQLNIIFDETALNQIKRMPNGDIDFGHGLILRKQERSEYKPFREIRHTSKAQGGLGYSNRHGICYGLSVLYGRYCKEALSQDKIPEERSQHKRDFIEILKQAGNNATIASIKDENKKDLAHTLLCDTLDLQNGQSRKNIENRFNDAILGDASHHYICPSLHSCVQSFVNFISEMKESGIQSSSVMFGTNDHAMNMTLERKIGTDVVKITFYDPNTKEGPIVGYIFASDLGNEQKIKEILEKSFYFSKQYKSVQAPSIDLICYPLDQSKKGEVLKLKRPDLDEFFKCPAPNMLGSLLCSAIRCGDLDFAGKIFDRDKKWLEDNPGFPSRINLLSDTYFSREYTIISWVISQKYYEIAMRIIEHSPIVLMQIDMGFCGRETIRTLFYFAISKGNSSVAAALLKRPEIDVDEGRRSFELALERGNTEMQKCLIDSGKVPPHEILRQRGKLTEEVLSHFLNFYLSKARSIFFAAFRSYKDFVEQNHGVISHTKKGLQQVKSLIDELGKDDMSLSRMSDLVKDFFKARKGTDSGSFISFLLDEIGRDAGPSGLSAFTSVAGCYPARREQQKSFRNDNSQAVKMDRKWALTKLQEQGFFRNDPDSFLAIAREVEQRNLERKTPGSVDSPEEPT